MQAVIMAAGSSTRTHPLTLTRPKPLVPIWGRPFLELQLRQLQGLVDEAVLVVGFLKEQIEERLGKEFEGIALRYAVQERQRGTADALLTARPFLSGPTLVLNGDDFYHHDDLRKLSRTGRGLLVARAKDPENRAVVSIEDGRVRAIVEKPASPAKHAWCSVGGYCVEEEDLGLLDDLPLSPRGELELPDFITRLIESTSVRPSPIERFWMPLTYAWDVLGLVLFLWQEPTRAQELGLASETPARLAERSDVSFGSKVEIEEPVWVGPNVAIGNGVRIVGPSAIGAGTSLDEGAFIERSVLFEDVRVGRAAKVSHSILGRGASVGAEARLSSAVGSSLSVDVKGKSVVPELERLGVVAGDFAVVPSRAAVPAGTLLPPGSKESP
jgi:bifunctional UDP-N-acetylglucosamine pyrophosphorylase/glucosamine-1-phosphate N-acetyltransferase